MSENPHDSPEDLEPTPPHQFSRRRLIAGLGLAAAGGGTAFYFGGGKRTVDDTIAKARIAGDRFYDHLKEEWDDRSLLKRHLLKDEADYRAFLNGLSLRYVTADEVIRPHRNVRGGVANELPPRHMWSRLVPTLKITDEIRHRLGTPLKLINSAYRSPEYNLACSGATQSYHMQNRALDLMFREGSNAAGKVARELRTEGFFKGGIGVYPTFIHVDTRGFEATWSV